MYKLKLEDELKQSICYSNEFPGDQLIKYYGLIIQLSLHCWYNINFHMKNKCSLIFHLYSMWITSFLTMKKSIFFQLMLHLWSRHAVFSCVLEERSNSLHHQLVFAQLNELCLCARVCLCVQAGGLLMCGRWWVLEVVSSLDLPASSFSSLTSPWIVMWRALWFPLKKKLLMVVV